MSSPEVQSQTRLPITETVELLRQVEAGEYSGIGRRMVTLGDELVLPEGVVRPENDSGLGVVSKYLGASAIETVRLSRTPNLYSPVENGKVVDKRLLAWLLIGRDQGLAELDGERFVDTAEAIAKKAVYATNAIDSMSILEGAKSSATDWRSLFEGFVKADIFSKEFQPLIVTSLGGYDGEVPLAAPFNVLPGLELMATLRQMGYDPRMTVTSAAKYGVDCNGLDLRGASDNWSKTAEAYQKLVGEYYPELEAQVAYETLWPGGLDTYPEKLVEAARKACEADETLRQTAEQYGAGPEAFVKYMLSHTQAFRDFQLEPEAPFVIKVGAPSELRFSRWQKLAIEQALPMIEGFVPNMSLVKRNGNPEYGQISLYYRRLGNRPPYYPDSKLSEYPEPALDGNYPSDYWDFLFTIDDNSPSLRRYDDLRVALEQTRLKPDEYLALFSGGSE